jgi:hypothetical protein
MAGKGRRFVFHGSFTSKSKAQRKERAAGGRFIRAATVKGRRRYLVMSERRR